MLSTGPWRCTWSLVAAIASFVVLVSLVHVLFSPLLPPSFGLFGVRSPRSSSSRSPPNGSVHVINGSLDEAHSPFSGKMEPDVNFADLFPIDSHGAVIYRGAPWKAEIGRWLSGCDSDSMPVDVVESIGSKECKDDCSFQGICNQDLGQCRCFHGYAGEGCTEQPQFNCNLPSTPKYPYGPWIVSICPAHCDTTRAMCFCGKQSAYPNRPLSEGCGFVTVLPSEPGGLKVTNWSVADTNVYSTNTSNPGWCNIDPKVAYASHIKVKEECDCKYDGLSGRFCEIPTISTCLNQCSGHGSCRGGFCQCSSGWYGIDCSIPSASSSMKEWPKWLRPSKVDFPDNGSISATVKKKRPLIYVYDLPPEFDSHLLEGRHYKLECVNRIYNDQNRTIWTDQLYGAQIALYESILSSPYRTMNGEEADYFFVPALDSCIITRAYDAPHLSPSEFLRLRSYITLDVYKKVYDHIVEEYTYWNRSSGKDHIWFFAWDEGACYAPKEIWNSIMLVHWGNTNSKHKNSTTAYWGDDWNPIPSEKRGNHTCFDPTKDLVLPAWKRPNPGAIWLRLWARTRKERKTLFYFNGNLGPAYEDGRPEETYSMGIRQKVAEEFGSTPDKKGRLGRQHAHDVNVTSHRTSNYFKELASSKFCGVFPGDGWSGRMEDSILQGCIPVIIQDGIFLPYENLLNYDSFAIRIAEDDIPNMINILRSINETQIDAMLENVRSIWQRFLYRDAVMLEAARQKHLYGKLDDWGVEFSNLKEDDAFSTFIQVLHYRLHNDPWRRGQNDSQKDFGLSETCLKGTRHD